MLSWGFIRQPCCFSLLLLLFCVGNLPSSSVQATPHFSVSHFISSVSYYSSPNHPSTTYGPSYCLDLCAYSLQLFPALGKKYRELLIEGRIYFPGIRPLQMIYTQRKMDWFARLYAYIHVTFWWLPLCLLFYHTWVVGFPWAQFSVCGHMIIISCPQPVCIRL